MGDMEQAFDEEDEVIYDKTTLLQRQPPKRAARRPQTTSQRAHILRLASLILLFVCLGISLAIPGPTLPCFEYLTHSEEHLVSCLFVGRAGGMLVASLLTQLLLDIVPADCLSVVGLLLLSIAHFFIPWSERVWWLVGAFALQGAAIGLVLSGALALVRLLYGTRHLNYRHAFLLALAMGCLLTPFLVMPFQADVNSKTEAAPVSLNATSHPPEPARVRRQALLSHNRIRRPGVGDAPPPPTSPFPRKDDDDPDSPSFTSRNASESLPNLRANSTLPSSTQVVSSSSTPSSATSTSTPGKGEESTPSTSAPTPTPSSPSPFPAFPQIFGVPTSSASPPPLSTPSSAPFLHSNSSHLTTKSSAAASVSSPSTSSSSVSPSSPSSSSPPFLLPTSPTSSSLSTSSSSTSSPASASPTASSLPPSSDYSRTSTSTSNSPSSSPSSSPSTTTTATSSAAASSSSTASTTPLLPALPHGGAVMPPEDRVPSPTTLNRGDGVPMSPPRNRADRIHPRPDGDRITPTPTAGSGRRRPSLQDRYHHLVGRISSLRPVQRIYLSLGALTLFVCLLCLHLCCACRRVPRLPGPGAVATESPALFGRRHFSPADLLFLGSLLLLCVVLAGLEVTLGNYLYSWARRERHGWSALSCLLLSAVFWAGLALGRLPLLLVTRCQRSGPTLLLLLHLLLFLVGSLLLLLLDQRPAVLWLSVGVAGIGLGPARPGLELWLEAGGLSGAEQRWLGTLTLVAAGLGEAVLPVLAAVLHQVAQLSRALWLLGVAGGAAGPVLFGLSAVLMHLRASRRPAHVQQQEEDEELLPAGDSDDPEDGTFALRKLRNHGNGRAGQQRLLGLHADDDELDLH